MEAALQSEMKSRHADLMAKIDATPELTDETDAALQTAMKEFFENASAQFKRE